MDGSTMAVTDSETGLHSPPMLPAPIALPPPLPVSRPALSLGQIYNAHAGFVFRALRSLGVQESGLDDAVQDVFMVVVRRHDDFEGRSTLRTWLYGITLRVAQRHRELARRRLTANVEASEDLCSPHSDPEQQSARAADARFLDVVLDTMSDPLREVFVLAELEQLTAPEIAALLGVKVNTVYSRLRLARERFTQALDARKALRSQP